MTENSNNDLQVHRLRRNKWWVFGLLILLAVLIWFVGRNMGTLFPTASSAPTPTPASVFPEITLPVGSVLTGTTALTGTGQPGNTVRVLVDGKEAATSQVDASGAWTITLSALPEGDHQVQVEATDAAGNTIAASEPITLTVTGPRLPQSAVAAPSLALPVGGVLTDTNVLTGTGQPGNTVLVLVDGKEVATAQVDASGAWTVTLNALPEGDHQVQVEATDAAGNTIAASEPITLTATSLYLPHVEVSPAIPALLTGGVITGTTELTGTGQPGNTVRVLVDGKETATAEVDANGAWTITLSALPEGNHQVQVEATDAAGNTIAVSEPITLTATAPRLPQSEVALPSLALPVGGAVTGTKVLTGTGQPGNTVRVLVDGKETATAEVDANGAWTVTLSALPEGNHQVQVEALDAAGNTIAASETKTLSVTSASTPPATTVPVSTSTTTTTATPVPTNTPTSAPKATLTPAPPNTPTSVSTATATSAPTNTPTSVPTATATLAPPNTPTSVSTATATSAPTNTPTSVSAATATLAPTNTPTSVPTATAMSAPTNTPTSAPKAAAALAPTSTPTSAPTATATSAPTNTPTSVPTATATLAPTNTPTSVPTATATPKSTSTPTSASTATATPEPTNTPTSASTATATSAPTNTPTSAPTATATSAPTNTPTSAPTATATSAPTNTPTSAPAATATPAPTNTPTSAPAATATLAPTSTPTSVPTATATPKSTNTPALEPTVTPANTAVITPIATSTTVAPAQTGTGLPQVEIAAPILTLPSGAVLTGTTVLSGTATPDALVRVLVDGKDMAAAKADASGIWTVTLTTLPAGDHLVQVEALDATGQVIAESAPVALTVTQAGTSAPLPTSTPAANATPPASSTATGATTPAVVPEKPQAAPPPPSLVLPAGGFFTSTAVLSGTATPGALVRVVIDGEDMAATKANANGVWTVTLTALPGGEHLMQVETMDATGMKIAASVPIAFLVTLAVGPTSPPASTSTTTATPEPASTLAITAVATPVPAPAAATISATAPGFPQAEAAAPILVLPVGGVFTGTTVLGGTGDPGSTVRILVDGNEAAAGEVAANGTWTATLEAVPAGDHLVQVEALDATGNVIAESAPVALTVTLAIPPTPPSTSTPAATVTPRPRPAATTVPGRNPCAGAPGQATPTACIAAESTAMAPSAEPPAYLPTTGLNWRGDAATAGLPLAVLTSLVVAAMLARRRSKHQ